MRIKSRSKKYNPVSDYLTTLGQLKQRLDQCQNAKLQSYTDFKLGRLSKDGFLAKKNELTKEAELLTEQMQQTRDSYERYLEEKAAEESRQAEIDKYAGHAGMTEEEMVALMYRGIERVLVFNDNRIEITWKFKDIFLGQSPDFS
jgi:hypothetical protein